MTVRLLAMTAAIGMLAACWPLSADKDKDGLTNKEEEELGLDPNNDDFDGDGLNDGDEIAAGTDPKVLDTDGDYMSDGDEVAAGTDPLNPDTDDDSYLDGEEDYEGTDPLDKGDRIYKGKWPYYIDKDDDLGSPSVGTAVVGEKFGRYKADDQNGERVDLFDFGGPDQTYDYIIIDISAEWCGPCNDLSAWLAGGSDSYFGEWDDVRDKVNAGEVAWITAMAQTNEGAGTTAEDSENWDSMYPNKHVVVMSDPDGEMISAVVDQTGFWPSAVVIKASNMKVKLVGGLDEALDFVR
jgi:thiol-disulfide isomerase/thioredoxin